MVVKDHQVWATISGTEIGEISDQVARVVDWGVEAIEYRVDLIPEELWGAVYSEELRCPVPWWVAHFGTGEEAAPARRALMAAAESGAAGLIFHSRCEHLNELIEVAQAAEMPFAAPYHSQEPLTLQGALDEYRFQESLAPTFRKIAVRALSFQDASALVEATHRASLDGGRPAVGAVFGPHRWARVALPHAGSAITFIVARTVTNEVGGFDEQLDVSEIDTLLQVRGLIDQWIQVSAAATEPRRAVSA